MTTLDSVRQKTILDQADELEMLLDDWRETTDWKCMLGKPRKIKVADVDEEEKILEQSNANAYWQEEHDCHASAEDGCQCGWGIPDVTRDATDYEPIN